LEVLELLLSKKLPCKTCLYPEISLVVRVAPEEEAVTVVQALLVETVVMVAMVVTVSME
jgi:hypothetical protein